jgi:dephospho-CoA kinase
MLKVGLTGGIGCGKSTATRAFQQLGVPVVDADQIAREVVGVGQPALAGIVGQFGGQALLADGSLNRAWLRQAVFGDPERLQRLESILHPRIREEIQRRIVGYAAVGVPYVIVDVPLLFEKQYQSLFDRVLVIDCLEEQQLARVQQRDGSDSPVIESIMRAQVSRTERLQQADDILENSGTLAEFTHKLAAQHEKYIIISASCLPEM